MSGAASFRTFLTVLLFCVAFCACGASVHVTPNVASTCVAGFRVPGKIDYDGNRDYLPRVIADAPSPGSPVVYRYAHAAQYGTQDVPELLALFNPLTLVGLPTGANTVRIAGKLDVVVDNAVIRTYSAGAVLDKTRSMFAGETYTELRRLGLIAVRDNLESQVCGDGEFLAGLSRRAPQGGSAGGAPKEPPAQAKTTDPGNDAPVVERKTLEDANLAVPQAAPSGVVGDPEEIAGYLRMGNKLCEDGDYGRAIGVYERILNVYPGNKEASEGLLRAEKARAAADHVPGR